MHSLTQRFFGLVLAVVFTANTLAPGHMHGCGMEERARQHQAMMQGAGMEHSMHSMAMPGHEAAAPQSGHQQHGAPGTQGDCHCVGHACCAAGVVLPATPVFPAVVTIAVKQLAGTAHRGTLITRAEHMLPPAQAPPALLA